MSRVPCFPHQPREEREGGKDFCAERDDCRGVLTFGEGKRESCSGVGTTHQKSEVLRLERRR